MGINMTKHFIQLFCVLSFCFATAQNVKYFDENWKETSKENASFYRTLKSDQELFEINDYYINGNIQFKGFASNNVEPFIYNGLLTWYYINGEIESKVNFKDGIQNGLYEKFYTNGKLDNTVMYLNGKRDGSYREYYDSGELQGKMTYVNGKKEGRSIEYYKDGKEKFVRNFKNDSLDGKFSAYWENGNLKADGFYVNGVFQNKYTEYFEDGKVAATSNIINGKMDGEYLIYFDDGKLKTLITNKDGVMNGKYEVYNRSGNLFNKGNAMNGYQEGECFDYYYEGELRKKYFIKNKNVDGKYYEYFRDKKISTEGEFKDGKALKYNSISLRKENGKTVSAEMTLKDGVENWKFYNDKILVVEAFYKDGFKSGLWKIYSKRTGKLLQTRDHKNNQKDGEQYLQTTRIENFDPFLFLSDRFMLKQSILDINSNDVLINTINDEDVNVLISSL